MARRDPEGSPEKLEHGPIRPPFFGGGRHPDPQRTPLDAGDFRVSRPGANEKAEPGAALGSRQGGRRRVRRDSLFPHETTGSPSRS
jgi:hypothetical protein